MKVEVCFKAKTKSGPFPSTVAVCALPPQFYEWFTNEVLEVVEIQDEEEVSRLQLQCLLIALTEWLTGMGNSANISSDDSAAYKATRRILYYLVNNVQTHAFRFSCLNHEEAK